MAPKEVGKCKAVSLKFKWKVNDVCIRCSKTGDYLKSPIFLVFSQQWYLKFYPKGRNADFENFLSIYLANSGTSAQVVYNIKLLNNEGKVLADETLREYAYNDTSCCWGLHDFASRDLVVDPANGLLTDGTMIFVCEITYVKNTIHCESKKRKIEVIDDDTTSRFLIDKYETLLNNDNFSDVSLIAEDKTIMVYKGILAKSSSVFAAMFENEMKEKQENIVEISDVKYDVLMEMLRFVYTGKVNNIDVLAGELAVAADKYAIDDLKTTCENTMTRNLNSNNVIRILQIADKLRMDKLKSYAVEFIVKSASNIVEDSEFDLLPVDLVRTVCRALAKK